MTLPASMPSQLPKGQVTQVTQVAQSAMRKSETWAVFWPCPEQILSENPCLDLLSQMEGTQGDVESTMLELELESASDYPLDCLPDWLFCPAWPELKRNTVSMGSAKPWMAALDMKPVMFDSQKPMENETVDGFFNPESAEKSLSESIEPDRSSQTWAKFAMETSPGAQIPAHRASVSPWTNQTTAKLSTPDWQFTFSEQILGLVQTHEHSASLHLNPPEWGVLAIEFTMSDQKLSIVFKAMESVAREALQESMPVLRELFSNQGIALDRVSVLDHSVEHSYLEEGGFQRQDQKDSGPDQKQTVLMPGSLPDSGDLEQPETWLLAHRMPKRLASSLLDRYI